MVVISLGFCIFGCLYFFWFVVVCFGGLLFFCLFLAGFCLFGFPFEKILLVLLVCQLLYRKTQKT